MSSNSDIATVDQKGRVKAVSNGSCTITAHSNVDDSLQASIDIIVDTNANIEILTYISDDYGLFPIETNTIKLGTTPQIKMFKNNEHYTNVEYSVDNEHIATIDENGILTTIAEGELFVTITDKADRRITYTKTFYIQIDEYIYGMKVYTVDNKYSIDEDKGQFQLIARGYPSGIIHRDVTYSVNDRRIATIDADTGLLTAVNNGVVKVKAFSKTDTTLDTYKTTDITISNQIPNENVDTPGEYTIEDLYNSMELTFLDYEGQPIINIDTDVEYINLSFDKNIEHQFNVTGAIITVANGYIEDDEYNLDDYDYIVKTIDDVKIN